MDLKYAINFKLREAKYWKQTKHSFTAREIHRNSGAQDKALPKPENYHTMQLTAHVEWDMRNLRCPDPSNIGTVEYELLKQGGH